MHRNYREGGKHHLRLKPGYNAAMACGASGDGRGVRLDGKPAVEKLK